MGKIKHELRNHSEIKIMKLIIALFWSQIVILNLIWMRVTCSMMINNYESNNVYMFRKGFSELDFWKKLTKPSKSHRITWFLAKKITERSGKLFGIAGSFGGVRSASIFLRYLKFLTNNIKTINIVNIKRVIRIYNIIKYLKKKIATKFHHCNIRPNYIKICHTFQFWFCFQLALLLFCGQWGGFQRDRGLFVRYNSGVHTFNRNDLIRFVKFRKNTNNFHDFWMNFLNFTMVLMVLSIQIQFSSTFSKTSPVVWETRRASSGAGFHPPLSKQKSWIQISKRLKQKKKTIWTHNLQNVVDKIRFRMPNLIEIELYLSPEPPLSGVPWRSCWLPDWENWRVLCGVSMNLCFWKV